MQLSPAEIETAKGLLIQIQDGALRGEKGKLKLLVYYCQSDEKVDNWKEAGFKFVKKYFQYDEVDWTTYLFFVFQHVQSGLFFAIKADADSWNDDHTLGEWNAYYVEPEKEVRVVYKPIELPTVN